MTESSEAVAALVRVLDCLRAELVYVGDLAGADRVLDFMSAAVAADEVMSALRREDAEAVTFHTGVLQRRLESACLPRLDIG
jgi:hypothetical protein